MTRVLPILGAVCVAGAAWTLLRLVDSGAATLDSTRVSWPWAAVSVVAMLVFVLLYAHASALLLRAVGGAPVPYGSASRLFLLTWPGRYVPAGLPYYGGRIAAAPSLGVTRAAMTVTLLYETLLSIAGAGITCTVLTVVVLHGRIPGALWVGLAGAGLAAAGASSHPAVFRSALRLGARRIRRLATLQAHVLPGGRVLLMVAIYAAAALVAGVALWAALHALDVQAPFALVCVAFNVAGIVGMLAVPLPSGMGVREAAIVALLAGVASPSEALAAAVLVRLAGVVADLLPFTAIVILHGFRRMAMPAPAVPSQQVTEAR